MHDFHSSSVNCYYSLLHNDPKQGTFTFEVSLQSYFVILSSDGFRWCTVLVQWPVDCQVCAESLCSVGFMAQQPSVNFSGSPLSRILM